MSLASDAVAIVTGASRGVGKGIALALGSRGMTVYLTGRSTREGDAPLPGTIHATASEVQARGGRGVAVACDHREDAAVFALFEQVDREVGHVDILVNNVFAVPDDLMDPKPFWEKPLSYWDDMIDLGLRAHFVASVEAAKRMVPAGEGLIVNISSPAARCFVHTPVYGIGKAGADKMAHDMARELRAHNVAALALWPGIVKTERTLAAMDSAPEAYEALMSGVESAEFPGLVIAALARDPELMKRSGQSWYTSELALEYGIQDIDGRQPESYREMLGGPVAPHPAMIR